MFEHRQVIINPNADHEIVDRFPMVLSTFEQARQHPWLKSLRWVLMHPRAKMLLQEYGHPEDDVIYCIGSDRDGFGVEPGGIDADFLRLNVGPDEESKTKEFHAAVVLPAVAYDRALKLWQKRHLAKQ